MSRALVEDWNPAIAFLAKASKAALRMVAFSLSNRPRNVRDVKGDARTRTNIGNCFAKSDPHVRELREDDGSNELLLLGRVVDGRKDP